MGKMNCHTHSYTAQTTMRCNSLLWMCNRPKVSWKTQAMVQYVPKKPRHPNSRPPSPQQADKGKVAREKSIRVQPWTSTTSMQTLTNVWIYWPDLSRSNMCNTCILTSTKPVLNSSALPSDTNKSTTAVASSLLLRQSLLSKRLFPSTFWTVSKKWECWRAMNIILESLKGV